MELLWVDLCRPRTIEELSFHPQINEVLRQLSDTNDFPHIILYGPQGAGKKTRALCFAHKIFGQGVYRLKSEEYSFKPENSSVNIEYNTIYSNHHIEITPSDNEHNDRHIIQKVVKDIASNYNVEGNNHKTFKLLIINEADRLTKEAQGALRRTMQKYIECCRMILICTNVHKLIEPIRSRCLNMRIPAASNAVIQQTLKKVCVGYSYNASDLIIEKICRDCNRNLRSAILQLQASKNSQNMLTSPTKKQIKNIAKGIIEEQSPSKLSSIRESLYDLIVNLEEPQTIIKEIALTLIDNQAFSQQLIKQILHHAAKHQKTISMGSKPIIHLQSFCAHVMEEILNSKKK